MYGPARLASSHQRRVQRRRSRQLAKPARRSVVTATVANPTTTAAAWTPASGLPDAGLTTKEPT